MAHRFPRQSKRLLKALRRLGYSLQPGRGDHVKALFITPCADGGDFKFSFPVDRGEIPEGTFQAILHQAGGLTEDHLLGAPDGTFTVSDYRAFIAGKSREELLRLTLAVVFTRDLLAEEGGTHCCPSLSTHELGSPCHRLLREAGGQHPIHRRLVGAQDDRDTILMAGDAHHVSPLPA